MIKSNQENYKENFTLCAIYLPKGIICWTLLHWFYLACTWYKGLFFPLSSRGSLSWWAHGWGSTDIVGLMPLGDKSGLTDPEKEEEEVGPRFPLSWGNIPVLCNSLNICKEPPVPVFKTYFRIRESPVSILWKKTRIKEPSVISKAFKNQQFSLKKLVVYGLLFVFS